MFIKYYTKITCNAILSNPFLSKMDNEQWIKRLHDIGYGYSIYPINEVEQEIKKIYSSIAGCFIKAGAKLTFDNKFVVKHIMEKYNEIVGEKNE